MKQLVHLETLELYNELSEDEQSQVMEAVLEASIKNKYISILLLQDDESLKCLSIITRESFSSVCARDFTSSIQLFNLLHDNNSF